jgi:hypothetical protein
MSGQLNHSTNLLTFISQTNHYVSSKERIQASHGEIAGGNETAG